MRSKLVFLTTMLILVVTVLSDCATSSGAEPAGPIEKTVYVGPTLEDCVGEGLQKCMLVKEEPEGEYTFSYNQIVGFEFEEGYEYKLLVEEEKVENPPAGGSSLRWNLIHIDSKTSVADPESSVLQSTHWKLISYLNQEGVLSEILANSDIIANFQAGQLTGKAGCNNYFGSYQVDGSNLTIGPLASTEMYCLTPPGLMDQESLYLAILETAANYKLDDDQLMITNAEGEIILIFIPVGVKSLTSNLWEAIMYNNGKDAVVSVVLGTEITAFFEVDGEIKGSAGCNDYSASYQIDGENISIGPAKITHMFCAEPDGKMDQEMQYLSTLGMVGTYKFEGDNLILMDSEGLRLVVYKPARTSDLFETIWYLDANNDGVEMIGSTMNGTGPTAIFDPNGNISGFAGCNNFAGTYEIEGTEMRIEIGPQTLKFCEEPEEVMVQEADYLEALQSTTHYQIRGDVLSMMDDAGKEVLDFKASDLIGYVWMWLEFLENNDTRTSPDNPMNYTIQFHPTGQVQVLADCNNAVGTYELDGIKIKVEIQSMSLAACSADSLSEDFIQLLNDAVIYSNEGEFLYLDIKFDTGTMKFIQ